MARTSVMPAPDISWMLRNMSGACSGAYRPADACMRIRVRVCARASWTSAAMRLRSSSRASRTASRSRVISVVRFDLPHRNIAPMIAQCATIVTARSMPWIRMRP